MKVIFGVGLGFVAGFGFALSGATADRTDGGEIVHGEVLVLSPIMITQLSIDTNKAD